MYRAGAVSVSSACRERATQPRFEGEVRCRLHVDIVSTLHSLSTDGRDKVSKQQYRNDPLNFSDRQVWANSVDTEQTVKEQS